MRDLEKEALWRARIDEWKASPETVSEFCRARGINEHTFRSWQKVLSNRDAEARRNGDRLRPGRRRNAAVLQLVFSAINQAC